MIKVLTSTTITSERLTQDPTHEQRFPTAQGTKAQGYHAEERDVSKTLHSKVLHKGINKRIATISTCVEDCCIPPPKATIIIHKDGLLFIFLTKIKRRFVTLLSVGTTR